MQGYHHYLVLLVNYYFSKSIEAYISLGVSIIGVRYLFTISWIRSGVSCFKSPSENDSSVELSSQSFFDKSVLVASLSFNSAWCFSGGIVEAYSF